MFHVLFQRKINRCKISVEASGLEKAEKMNLSKHKNECIKT